MQVYNFASTAIEDWEKNAINAIWIFVLVKLISINPWRIASVS